MRIRTFPLVCIFLIAFFIVHPADIVQPADGNWLVENMKDYEKWDNGDIIANKINVGTCYGYVLAIAHILYYENILDHYIDSRQDLAVVTKYLKAHHERWSEYAYILVIDALKESFPKKQ